MTLLVTGSFGDKAFNDSAQAGMKKLEEELGDKVEVNMVEMGSDKTKFEGSMLDACESDADLIITGLWDMKEITEKVAQEFPEKKFIIFALLPPPPDICRFIIIKKKIKIAIKGT